MGCSWAYVGLRWLLWVFAMWAVVGLRGCREPMSAHVGCCGFLWAFVGTSVGRVNGIKKETIKKTYLGLETRHLEPLLLLLPLLACIGLHWLLWAFVGLLVW